MHGVPRSRGGAAACEHLWLSILPSLPYNRPAWRALQLCEEEQQADLQLYCYSRIHLYTDKDVEFSLDLLLMG